jgi:hypothetical protein
MAQKLNPRTLMKSWPEDRQDGPFRTLYSMAAGSVRFLDEFVQQAASANPRMSSAEIEAASKKGQDHLARLVAERKAAIAREIGTATLRKLSFAGRTIHEAAQALGPARIREVARVAPFGSTELSATLDLRAIDWYRAQDVEHRTRAMLAARDGRMPHLARALLRVPLEFGGFELKDDQRDALLEALAALENPTEYEQLVEQRRLSDIARTVWTHSVREVAETASVEQPMLQDALGDTFGLYDQPPPLFYPVTVDDSRLGPMAAAIIDARRRPAVAAVQGA